MGKTSSSHTGKLMKEISIKMGVEKANRGSSHALPQTGKYIYFSIPVKRKEDFLLAQQQAQPMENVTAQLMKSRHYWG